SKGGMFLTSESMFEAHPELRDLVLRLEGEEMKLDTEKTQILFTYLLQQLRETKLSNQIKSQKKRIQLPRWVERRYFDLFIKLAQTSKLPKLDLTQTKKLISLCELFKTFELINILLTESVLP